MATKRLSSSTRNASEQLFGREMGGEEQVNEIGTFVFRYIDLVDRKDSEKERTNLRREVDTSQILSQSARQYVLERFRELDQQAH